MQKLDEHSPQYLRFDLLINFCELSIDEFFMTFNWCVCVCFRTESVIRSVLEFQFAILLVIRIGVFNDIASIHMNHLDIECKCPIHFCVRFSGTQFKLWDKFFSLRIQMALAVIR